MSLPGELWSLTLTSWALGWANSLPLQQLFWIPPLFPLLFLPQSSFCIMGLIKTAASCHPEQQQQQLLPPPSCGVIRLLASQAKANKATVNTHTQSALTDFILFLRRFFFFFFFCVNPPPLFCLMSCSSSTGAKSAGLRGCAESRWATEGLFFSLWFFYRDNGDSLKAVQVMQDSFFSTNRTGWLKPHFCSVHFPTVGLRKVSLFSCDWGNQFEFTSNCKMMKEIVLGQN